VTSSVRATSTVSFRDRLSFRRRRELLELVRRQVRPDPTTRVLDLGGGTGVTTEFFARGAAEITVLDPDPRKIARGRAVRPTISFIEGVAENLPFSEGRFERVVSLLSFHHLGDARKAFTEIFRVLAPGGLLVICDVEADSLPARLFRILHRITLHGPLSFVAPAVLDAWLAATGFRPRQRSRLGSYYILTAEK